MNMHQPQVTLTDCDREPIHQIGAIQSFGGLLAVGNDWLVAHRSTNLAEILDLDALPEIGTPLRDIFQGEAIDTLRQAVAQLVEPDAVDRLFGLDLFANKRLFDCALHISDGLTILEFEPHADGDLDRGMSMLRPIMAKLEKHRELSGLANQAVTSLRQILGYDRVMFYRFHPDGSGEVVAEDAREDLESYLNLRYPRTDIPQQARALFVRNRFRVIADIGAEPVPIEPAETLHGEPLDLSMSVLRAQSPIHVEYLKNMGVGASLSIAVVVRGELWGLFACHHYEPRIPPYSLRTVAELFSELYSLSVERMLALQETRQGEQGRELHDRLIRAAADGESLARSLPSIEPIVERAVPHDGLSAYVDGEYQATGSAPSEDEFRALLPKLNSSASGRLIASEGLAERIPEAEAFADRAVGALILPVSRAPRDYFVLWRRELAETVTWAGNPEKSVEFGPNGDRLTPRKSFEAWRETVRGRSTEWTDTEVKLAESLRVSLLEVILRLTDDAMQERDRAQQQQELLIAELNHRVRNILNLIRGVINQSRGDASDIESYAELISGRISSLAAAHDNITRQNWVDASLRELIDTEADAYIGAKVDRLQVTGADAMLSPDAYTVLALVIHEMITNSVKYGSLCDRSGKLEVDIADDEEGLTVRWKESGGPPVKAPKRRGFGSTIIEKSIPFELKGRSKLDYKLSGVEAEFWIPAQYVRTVDADANKKGARARGKASSPAGGVDVPKRVLLVEDSMIIALDIEECLLSLGAEHVKVESTVSGALSSLRKEAFDVAILDYNLGSESSDPIAKELKKKDIPFYLATGYGELAEKAEELGATDLLAKPYGRDELVTLFSSD